MALPKTSTHSCWRPRAGVTILEILLVIGLLAIILGLGLIATFDSFRDNSFNNERNMLVLVLQKARSQAMSGVCLGTSCVGGKEHGVEIQSGSYVIFQGSSYASRDVVMDENIAANYSVNATGLLEFVFEKLSGDATPLSVGSVTLADQAGHISAISINSEGRIAWTN